MLRTVFAFCAALALAAAPSAAQSISGHVIDDKGAPIARVRVLLRAESDTSGAALHVAYTNDRGEYHIPLGMSGRYLISALRMGFRPDSGRTIDVGAGDARANLVMRNAPMPLPAVGVVAHADLSCVALDSPRQSRRVREWVTRAQDLIRARRAIEREYTYRIHETRRSPAARGRMETLQQDFVQRPGDPVHLGSILSNERGDTSAHAPSLSAGKTWWGWPDEGAVIRPSFTATMCFDTTAVRVAAGTYELRFRQIVPASHGFVGSLRMTDRGMVTQLFVGHSGYIMDGTIFYSPIDLDGEPLPFIARVIGDPMRDRTERRFTYSDFVRARQLRPLGAPASPH